MELAEGKWVVVVGVPTVKKVCDYDGKRWAWVALDRVALRVDEGEPIAEWFGMTWVTDLPTTGPAPKRKVKMDYKAIGVEGKLTKIATGWTLTNRKLLDLNKFGVFKADEGDDTKDDAKKGGKKGGKKTKKEEVYDGLEID